MKQFLVYVAYIILGIASNVWDFVRFTGGKAPDDYVNVFDHIYGWILFNHDDEAECEVGHIYDGDGNRLRYEYTVGGDGSVTVLRRNIDVNTVDLVGTIDDGDGAEAFLNAIEVSEDDDINFISLKVMLVSGRYFGEDK